MAGFGVTTEGRCWTTPNRSTKSSLVIAGGDFNLDACNVNAAAAFQNRGFHGAVRLPELPTTADRLLFKRGRCIDWIYVSNGVCSEGRVHNAILASDHYPVSATFAIP